MSNHKDGSSIVINGEYKGLSFSEYLEKKEKLFGVKTVKNMIIFLS